MEDLALRISRLEAIEAVRGAFAKYVLFMDGGRVDDLLEVFAEDGELIAENEPAGSGLTVHRKGRSDVEKHYRQLPYGTFRHHTTNTTVDVSADATQAELSSYFLTAKPNGIKGGLYEILFIRDHDGSWHIQRLHIASSWAWQASAVENAFYDALADHTLRGGAPAVWDQVFDTALPASG